MTTRHDPATVLYVVLAPFFAGAERALMLLLQALDATRYRPYVLVGTDGELLAQLRAAGIPCSYAELRYSDWRHPLAWMRSVARIAAVTRRTRAALVHSNTVPGFQPAGYAARLLGIPAIVHVRGKLGAYSWFLRPGYRRALFVSRDLMDFALQKDAAAFKAGAEVVYDGVVLPDPPSATDRQARRAELGIPAGIPAVVLSGQVVEIKGIWEYIEAARILRDAGILATFVVLGDDLRGNGAMRRAAEARVAALGLSGSFRFLGFRRDAPQLIPLFDIAAVPSHVEPLGNATLEAMASGLPVVGSRVGGIPEMIVDGETGFLVPAREPAALAHALGRLINDGPLRTRLGNAGRIRAEGVFSVPAHALHVQRIYDEVLGGTGLKT